MSAKCRFSCNVFGGLLAIALLTGCTMTYKPRESKYDTDRIPLYTCGTSVELKNGQVDPYIINFFENMGMEYEGNMYDWTDVAIGVAERQLEQRGSGTAPTSQKSLTLKVTKASATKGTWGFRAHIVLEVTTAYGSTRSFRASAPSSSMQNATSGALSSAVTRALSDPEIMFYLQQK